MTRALYQKSLLCVAVTLLASLVWSCTRPSTQYPSVRAERKGIEAGNRLYASRDYQGALAEYTRALQANGTSPEALFNASCARMRMAEGLRETDQAQADSLADMASQGFMMVASMRDRASSLAASALYNLGNRQFRAEDYQKAIAFYIQALRINPGFDQARRNLRIAQLKQQENQDQQKDQDKQDQQQNQDQDKDKDQQQDKQDQDKQDQDKQDKQDQDQQQQQQQQQQSQERLPQQAADRILQANQRQEEATRARLQMRNRQRREAGQPVSRKKW